MCLVRTTCPPDVTPRPAAERRPPAPPEPVARTLLLPLQGRSRPAPQLCMNQSPQVLLVGAGWDTLIGRRGVGLRHTLSVLHHLQARFRSVVAGCKLGSSRASPGERHPPPLQALSALSQARGARPARVTTSTQHNTAQGSEKGARCFMPRVSCVHRAASRGRVWSAVSSITELRPARRFWPASLGGEPRSLQVPQSLSGDFRAGWWENAGRR